MKTQALSQRNTPQILPFRPAWIDGWKWKRRGRAAGDRDLSGVAVRHFLYGTSPRVGTCVVEFITGRLVSLNMDPAP